MNPPSSMTMLTTCWPNYAQSWSLALGKTKAYICLSVCLFELQIPFLVIVIPRHMNQQKEYRSES